MFVDCGGLLFAGLAFVVCLIGYYISTYFGSLILLVCGFFLMSFC